MDDFCVDGFWVWFAFVDGGRGEVMVAWWTACAFDGFQVWVLFVMMEVDGGFTDDLDCLMGFMCSLVGWIRRSLLCFS